MTLASISDVAAAAPWSFALGFVLGVLVSDRWVLVRPRRRSPEERETGGSE